MSETGKTGQRIASKGEYARMETIRYGLRFSGATLILFSVLTLLWASLAFFLAAAWAMTDHLHPDPTVTPEASRIGVKYMLAGLVLFYLGRVSRKKSASIERVIPLSNTAHLPAPESLVRASAETTRTQEAVLLRAATSAQAGETPAEQLVRPAL